MSLIYKKPRIPKFQFGGSTPYGGTGFSPYRTAVDAGRTASTVGQAVVNPAATVHRGAQAIAGAASGGGNGFTGQYGQYAGAPNVNMVAAAPANTGAPYVPINYHLPPDQQAPGAVGPGIPVAGATPAGTYGVTDPNFKGGGYGTPTTVTSGPPAESEADRAARMGAEADEIAAAMDQAREDAAKAEYTKKVQRINGLVEDGIWGAKTEEAFNKVKARQEEINAANPDGPQLKVDGLAGPKTMAAIQAADAAKSAGLREASDANRKQAELDAQPKLAEVRPGAVPAGQESTRELRKHLRQTKRADRKTARVENRAERKDNRQMKRTAKKIDRKSDTGVASN